MAVGAVAHLPSSPALPGHPVSVQEIQQQDRLQRGSTLVWEAAAHETLLEGSVLRRTLMSTELIQLEQTSPE